MSNCRNNTWSLKQTKQCSKCPWKVSTDPRTIPNGYSFAKHQNLQSTIATGLEIQDTLNIMACHLNHDAHCIGWLHNQLGRGNNITLRLAMLSCSNSKQIQIFGAQHLSFQATLPKM